MRRQRNELADALRQQTVELRLLCALLEKQNRLAEAGNTVEAHRALADLISGQLGQQVTKRMASGELARY